MPRRDDTSPIRTGGNAAGQVEFDSRGNSVWRWTGPPDLDTTTHLLKRLDNAELQLEPTRSVPIPGSRAAADRAGGVNPRARAEPRGAWPETPRAGRHRDSTTKRSDRGTSSDPQPFAIADDEPRRGGFDPYNHSK